MGFEVLETVTKENAPVVATVSYSRFVRKDKRPASGKLVYPRLLVTIPTVICGISKKKRFVFQLGSGNDGGKARISASGDKDKRGIEPVIMRNAYRFNFGYVPKFGMDAAAAEQVPVRRIDDDHFEIDLPAWFNSEPRIDSR